MSFPRPWKRFVRSTTLFLEDVADAAFQKPEPSTTRFIRVGKVLLANARKLNFIKIHCTYIFVISLLILLVVGRNRLFHIPLDILTSSRLLLTLNIFISLYLFLFICTCLNHVVLHEYIPFEHLLTIFSYSILLDIYMMFMIFLSSILIYPFHDISYIDSLYFGASIVSQGGLNP